MIDNMENKFMEAGIAILFFSVIGQTVSIINSVGYMVFIAALQFECYRVKTTTDNI